MNLEQINEIISNYDKLVVLAKEKIKFLESLDSQYRTARGIESISFENEYVEVKCDDSCRGCYDTYYFSFPILFLSKSNEELEQIIIDLREVKEERERRQKEAEKRKQEDAKEKSDFTLYQKLKEKFEKNPSEKL